MTTTSIERIVYRRESAVQSLLRSRLAILDDLARMPEFKVGSKFHLDRLEVLATIESRLARAGVTN